MEENKQHKTALPETEPIPSALLFMMPYVRQHRR